MSTFIHDADGQVMAWAPDAKIAELDAFTDEILTAKGWTRVSGQPEVEDASAWDVESKSVVVVEKAPPAAKDLGAAFTPDEFAKIVDHFAALGIIAADRVIVLKGGK